MNSPINFMIFRNSGKPLLEKDGRRSGVSATVCVPRIILLLRANIKVYPILAG
jgi:hypothetical protein